MNMAIEGLRTSLRVVKLYTSMLVILAFQELLYKKVRFSIHHCLGIVHFLPHSMKFMQFPALSWCTLVLGPSNTVEWSIKSTVPIASKEYYI